ncbi:MAG: hypothetical protein JWQ35_2555 [Bacteriovoracaceae bacterium]|nr:hypothetical protein [Bacteriovoracaceae bacterium]
MSIAVKISLVVLVALGLLSLKLMMIQNETAAWFHILIGSLLFLGFGLTGLFFTSIQFLTSAKWSVALRRVMEAMALTLPVAGLLFIVVFFGIHHLFEWSHPDVVAADAILKGKAAFLNEHFFGIRLIAYFAIWIGASWILIRNSFKQDISGDASLSRKNFKISAFVLVLFGLSVTLAAFDLLMSLEPHWFSTIFGIYFFAGFFEAGLAMLLILTWTLYRSGTLRGFVSRDHFHDITRFIFAFSVFWAYIAFSQFMLIWYGNLPEETFFYIERLKNGWQWVSLALLLVRFAIPFLVLLPFGAKRVFAITIPIAILVIFGEWLDLYWIAIPAMRNLGTEGAAIMPGFGWKELSIGLGYISLFLLVIGFIMERIRMVPIKDPRLEASVHYYHH